MTFTLRNIQYHPDTGAVALLLEHALGSFFVNTTEAALTARMPSASGTWGNDEARAEAIAGVEARFPGEGYTVVLPPPPPVEVAPAMPVEVAPAMSPTA